MLTGKELCNILVREQDLPHTDFFGRIINFDWDSKLILPQVLFQELLRHSQIKISSMNVSRHVKYIDIFNGWSNPTIEVELDCNLSPFEIIFSKNGNNYVIELPLPYRVGWQLGQRLGTCKINDKPESILYAKAWGYGKMLGAC